MLRRILLGAVTALIVARPLVLGEDPGLLIRQVAASSLSADSYGLVLTLFWFVIALGWAGWRAWTGNGRWGIGLIEGGLLLIAGLMFLGAAAVASYKNPAYLIAWEWLALALAFVLVRRLARDDGEQHRLLAALVASAISISAYAIYQYVHEFPDMRRFLDEQIQAAPANYWLVQSRDRLDLGVYGTFVHPNSFSGYLGLFLPAGLGWAWVAWRCGGWSWKSAATAGCALTMVIALLLTRSKGAILGTLLVAALVAGIQLRRSLASRRALTFAGLVAFAIACVAVLVTLQGTGRDNLEQKTVSSFAKRLDYWSATWKMLNDPEHPAFFWLGVGPGNFSRYYPRFMLETADEEIKDPHNWAFDLWTNAGIFSLLALVMVLALLFVKTWPAVQSPIVDEDSTPDEGEQANRTTRWEFYLGGMLGLTLGFILRTMAQPHRDFIVILDEGIVAGVRSLLWFACFALLESIAWPGPSRVLAIMAGVAVLFLNLTVSGGISFPAVALPLMVMMALAQSAMPAEEAEPERSRSAALTPLPILAGVCLGYLLLCFHPVTSSTQQVRKVIPYYEGYEKALVQAHEGNVVEEQRILNKAHEYLQSRIIGPLQLAAKDDPSDAFPQLQLAEWNGKLWELRYEMQGKSDEGVRLLGLKSARQVTFLDPQSLDGHLALYRLNTLFAKRADPKIAEELHARAARQFRDAVERAPTNAYLRYQLAEALFRADNPKEGKLEAAEALRLDELSSNPSRQLNEPHRRQARKWLGLQE